MRRRALRVAGVIYLALLVASCVARRVHPPSAPVLEPEDGIVRVGAIDGDRVLDRTVRLVYRRAGRWNDPDAPVVVLLHGSPGGKRDFARVVPPLAGRFRVLVPDLPGFGASERDVPDYSFRAHGRYVLELLDALGIDSAHLVGFSMGGGVALSAADLAPRRVRSITLLSAIGVQEMELLGDYTLNHAIHGIQLGLLWGLRELTPHFGWLDDVMLDVPYARNFFDSDQRPLRGILPRWSGPMLILHGERDPLVPVQAAREHARLVPQSELVVTTESHFMVFQEGERIAGIIAPFILRAERGEATVRATASRRRIAAAARPFDPRSLPRLAGVPWLIALLLLTVSTFASEDLACVGGGLMVAAGRLAFVPATAACLLGIFAGDLGLFVAGRMLGRAALARRPLRWVVHPAQVERSSEWFRRRGAAVIVASRFLPGTRLPTYLAAGILQTSFWRFALWFGVAAILWTPVLVGIAALVGAPILGTIHRYSLWALPVVAIAAVVALVVARIVPRLFSWRGRRLLAGSWRRVVRWEYWPPYVFYPPVVAYALWLGIRKRSVTLFTAANPGIEAGGFVNESKAAILRGLAGAGDAVARWSLAPASAAPEERRAIARAFALPVVLKPDTGQRGSGVVVARSWETVDDYLERARYDVIVQEHVPGVEHGIFYYRFPSEPRGRIFAITRKEMPVVTGDGRSTLEELILADPRTVPMARAYLTAQEARRSDVVPEAARVELVELGTHARGAYFYDGADLATPELEEAVDRISRSFDGFYFGRYDVRSASTEAFRRGAFKVIELNGVTSEATS
ncbi:MAG TPA: alpha/beta fold hydrolase, partial [Candidatus Polarisedimenticolaceae bacterium]|nr:alpha/beta fold hydrolase [Candidatus Polarisedimenticolaceae bacterium]